MTPIFTGRVGRDGRMHIYVNAGRRRYPVARAGLARAILTQFLGGEFAESDLYRFYDFKQHVLGPLLEQSEWTLAQDAVREWASRYRPSTTAPTPEPATGPSPRRKSAEPAARRTSSASAAEEAHERLDVDWENGQVTEAELVYRVESAVLLRGSKPIGRALPIGSVVRLHVRDASRSIQGRIAAYGRGDAYLVALGTRAVRRAPRYRVDLPATIHSPYLPNDTGGRIVDLSAAGARVSGLSLPLGADLDLRFVPPGESGAVTMRAIVVRCVPSASPPEAGIAFCMAALKIDARAVVSAAQRAS